jgi:hypothetical protein
MSTPYELLARANTVYSKYEKYVVQRPGEGEDEDWRRADGAYGVAYSAMLDRVNGLMQARRRQERGREGVAPLCRSRVPSLLSHPSTPESG